MKKNLRMLLIMLAVLVVVGGGAAALLLTMPAQEEETSSSSSTATETLLETDGVLLCLGREHRGQLRHCPRGRGDHHFRRVFLFGEQLLQHHVHGGGLGEL